MRILFNFLAVLILIPFYSKAGNNKEKYPYSKEKTITKTFTVNADATAQISNSYGAITVQLWDENKISVTTKITVSGKKENIVSEKLDETNIDFLETTTALISAKTIFSSDKSWGWDWGKSDVNYQVNYTVLIPKRGHIILHNNYGNILVAKLNGNSTIKCNYGDVIAGDLLGEKNNFNLNYSDNSKVNFVNKLTLNANYSDFLVSKGESATISGNYNKYQLNNVDKIHATGNYNDYNVKNSDHFNGSGNYQNLSFSNVANTTLSVNYGQINIFSTNNFKNATITSNYTSIKINTPTELSFDFDIRCLHGNLKTDLNLDYSLKSTKNNINQYKGNRNSTGKSKFTVVSNYGSVHLTSK
jgi:hypothetical protein